MQIGFFREIAFTSRHLPCLPSLSACIPSPSREMVNAMPLVAQSTFRSLIGLGNPHLQTLLPAIARHIPPLPWSRERLELMDGDFLIWIGSILGKADYSSFLTAWKETPAGPTSPA